MYTYSSMNIIIQIKLNLEFINIIVYNHGSMSIIANSMNIYLYIIMCISINIIYNLGNIRS